MMKIEFTSEEIEAVRHCRFHHPHPHVQRKLEVLYLKSQGIENEEIVRLCAISKTTFYRYLHGYIEGGIEKLKEVNFHRQQGQLSEVSADSFLPIAYPVFVTAFSPWHNDLNLHLFVLIYPVLAPPIYAPQYNIPQIHYQVKPIKDYLQV